MKKDGPAKLHADRKVSNRLERYGGKVVRRFWLDRHNQQPVRAEVRVHRFGLVVWWEEELAVKDRIWHILISGEGSKEYLTHGRDRAWKSA